MKVATWLVVCCALAACAVGRDDVATSETSSALGSPPPTVTVTQRPDGLAVSWTSLSVVSYSVMRGGVPLTTVNAPTTSYVDANVFAGVTYCYTVAGVFDDGSSTPQSNQACAVAGAPATRSVTIAIDGTAFDAITSATAVTHSSGCAFSGGLGVQAPLYLPQDSTITAARFYVQDNTATVLQGRVQGRDAAFGLTGIITTGSSGTGASQTLSIPRTMSTSKGHGYFLQVTYFSGAAQSNIAFAEVDYVPAM